MRNYSKTFQKISKVVIVILTILFVYIVWFDYFGSPNSKNNLNLGYKIEKIALGGAILNIEIADTSPLRELGLSGRKTLDSNTGMLFIFDNDGNWGFWMKQMNFPLDIIWFDQNFKIVSLQKNLLPQSHPTVFYPGKNSRYVLEVNSGFAEKSKIKIGDQ